MMDKEIADRLDRFLRIKKDLDEYIAKHYTGPETADEQQESNDDKEETK